MDKALQFPGVSNAWTMPIRARIDMLSTGIRTPVGIKIFGKDLGEMEKIAREVEGVVRSVPGTSSAYAERVIGGYYLEIIPDRLALGRYGLTISDIQDVISTALGGETVTTTVEGRERYAVNIRYPRALRSSPQTISTDVQVPLAAGGSVPLGQVASVKLTRGATSIRTENGQLAVYIYVDITGRDLGGYVAEAQQAVAQKVKFPPGYYVSWSGQFEYLERAEARLKIVVPVTLLIIFLLLYLNFRKLADTLIVMLSLPFSLVGGIWLMWWLGFNMSVAVAVGFIALAGVAAETGVVMLIYLEQAMAELKAERAATCEPFTRVDLYDAIMVGAVDRVRPKMMTVVAIMAGLVPILWSTGTGSEVMQRIAVPMIGGMVSSTRADPRGHSRHLCDRQGIRVASLAVARRRERRWTSEFDADAEPASCGERAMMEERPHRIARRKRRQWTRGRSWRLPFNRSSPATHALVVSANHQAKQENIYALRRQPSLDLASRGSCRRANQRNPDAADRLRVRARRHGHV